MSDWNPTDDELRDMIEGPTAHPDVRVRDLARLVLWERGIAREVRKMALHRAETAPRTPAATSWNASCAR